MRREDPQNRPRWGGGGPPRRNEPMRNRFGGGGGPNRQRPAPPRKPVKPKGPAIIDAKEPAKGKERRRMLKAAVWRLAKLLRVRPAVVLATLDLEPLLEKAAPGFRTRGLHEGDALRLMAKIKRLREWRRP